MSVKKIYAVYVGFYPDYKYEDRMESLWTSVEDAQVMAKKLFNSRVFDKCIVYELSLDIAHLDYKLISFYDKTTGEFEPK